jgi:hypothetical protein
MSDADALIAVAAVGEAEGARAVAAALACAHAGPDRAALLVALCEEPAPRPTLLASAAARALEERLAAHLPDTPVASRGGTCHLVLSPDQDGIDLLPSVLPLVRGTPAVLHVPPSLLGAALEGRDGTAAAVALRGDLGSDRPLIALVVRRLLDRGHRVSVLKRPLPWLASRCALLGISIGDSAGGLPPRLVERMARD